MANGDATGDIVTCSIIVLMPGVLGSEYDVTIDVISDADGEFPGLVGRYLRRRSKGVGWAAAGRGEVRG